MDWRHHFGLFWWDIPKTYEKLKRQLTKEVVGNTKLKKLNSKILDKTALILILFQNPLRIDTIRVHLIKIFREKVIKEQPQNLLQLFTYSFSKITILTAFLKKEDL